MKLFYASIIYHFKALFWRIYKSKKKLQNSFDYWIIWNGTNLFIRACALYEFEEGYSAQNVLEKIKICMERMLWVSQSVASCLWDFDMETGFSRRQDAVDQDPFWQHQNYRKCSTALSVPYQMRWKRLARWKAGKIDSTWTIRE